MAGPQIDGLIICFDLNNLKSLETLPRYFTIAETMLGNVQNRQGCDEVIEKMIETRQVERTGGRKPHQIMVVGCKKDLVDKNRA